MFALPANRPALMGILNVTPDSFSDGGIHFEAAAAINGAMRMIENGADLIDIGGESTRPGSEGISVDEELRRVLPVVEFLAGKGVPVSIDTANSEVARRALQAGARVVNDVTAFGDPEMPAVCAAAGCTVCLMHMKGTPRTMQADPQYGDVVKEVRGFLIGRAEYAQEEGVKRENIWIDPGIGFGKTITHNLELLKYLDRLAGAGYPVLIGTSRKSFLGKLLGVEGSPLPADQRLEGTLATQVWAQICGARIIRAHDVAASRRAIETIAAVQCGRE